MNPQSNMNIPTVTPLDFHAPPSPEMNESVAAAVKAVKRIVDYDFNTNNKKLLEEALTHPSCCNNAAVVSYNRLAFLGDTVLGLAVSNHLFHAYPGIDKGDLTLLRSANVSTEKLARAAVQHGLYAYLRRTATTDLDVQVKEFTEAVSREEKTPLCGGSVEAPKVLADIVESVAGAIYVDLNSDLEHLWLKFKHVLEPIVTLEELEKHPVTKLKQFCDKHGKKVNFKHGRNGMESTARVYVDGELVALGSAAQKEIAKINAAEMALCNLMQLTCIDDASVEIDGSFPVERAKDKLHKICAKKKWPVPIYTVEHEEGPPHAKKFVYKVTIESIDGVLFATGDQKSKRLAQNSAASQMILSLQDSNTFEAVKQSEHISKASQ